MAQKPLGQMSLTTSWVLLPSLAVPFEGMPKSPLPYRWAARPLGKPMTRPAVERRKHHSPAAASTSTGFAQSSTLLGPRGSSDAGRQFRGIERMRAKMQREVWDHSTILDSRTWLDEKSDPRGWAGAEGRRVQDGIWAGGGPRVVVQTFSSPILLVLPVPVLLHRPMIPPFPLSFFVYTALVKQTVKPTRAAAPFPPSSHRGGTEASHGRAQVNESLSTFSWKNFRKISSPWPSLLQPRLRDTSKGEGGWVQRGLREPTIDPTVNIYPPKIVEGEYTSKKLEAKTRERRRRRGPRVFWREASR